jgi:ActD protein
MSATPNDVPRLWGLLAEFASPHDLVRAAARVRDAGYTKWDAHTPFPVHGLDGAMGIKTTRLPYLVLAAGLTGTVSGLLMQWWMNAIDYPIIISGKPFNSLPADIPVTFELTVLLASLAAFVGMLIANALPRFHHPVFGNRHFRRVTTDAFFLAVEAADPRFDLVKTEQLLVAERALHVSPIEG